MKVHLALNTWLTRCGKRHTLIRRNGTLLRQLPVAENLVEVTCKKCPITKDHPPDNAPKNEPGI